MLLLDVTFFELSVYFLLNYYLNIIINSLVASIKNELSYYVIEQSFIEMSFAKLGCILRVFNYC